jgi:MOSC domain-containing protein YiiM
VNEFQLLSINVSREVGVPKTPVERAVLRAGHGIEGDAHAGDWHRQVSLLADEDIETFAENLTTRGLDLSHLPVGSRLRIGRALLEITQIGKECHEGCAIRRQVGDCVMPRCGVFARVLEGGEIGRASRCHHDL